MELVQGTGIDSAGPSLSCSGLALGPGVLQALGLLYLWEVLCVAMGASFALAFPLFTFLRLWFSLKEQTETKNCIPCCSGNSSLVQRGCWVPQSSFLTGHPAPPPPPASVVMPAVNSGRCWLLAHQAQEGLWPFQLLFPRLLVLLYYWQVKLVEKSFPEQTKLPQRRS